MPSCSVCQKTLFLTIWWVFDPLKKQRAKKHQRQTNRTRRRTGGTLECDLCSKSKYLAKQAFFKIFLGRETRPLRIESDSCLNILIYILTIWWFFDPLKKQRPRIYSEAFA